MEKTKSLPFVFSMIKNKKFIFNMEKKAELTLGTIVAILLAIIGFAIVLSFFFIINWGSEVDRTTCHQSVIYRGTLPTFGGAKDYVPLKCKTGKYCVSSKKGAECDELKNAEDVSVVKVSDKEEIERFIARDVLECWKMMGEGKVSIFSDWLNKQFGIGSTYPSCVICSRIAFDKENLEASGVKLDEVNVREYMLTHTVPGKDVSYAKYLAGENGKVSVGARGDFEMRELVEVDGELVFGEGPPINTSATVEEEEENPEVAVMFMQISAPLGSEVWKNTLGVMGVGLGAAFFTSPLAVGRAVFSQAGLAVGVLAGVGLIVQQVNVKGNRAVTAGYCDVVSVGEEARQGCSVVVSTDYDASSISQYCKKIESIA